MALYHSTGTVLRKSEIRSGKNDRTGGTWQRMTLVIEVDGYQGASIKQCFSAFGERVDEANAFRTGDKVEVTWSLYAHEWNGTWYPDVDIVRISRLEDKQPEAAQDQPVQTKPEPQTPVTDNEDDDLPF